MGKFVDFVASHERKRKVRMICSSWPNYEKRKIRPFVSSSTISAPIGANVKITKSRVLKRMSKNDSVLHKHVKWLKELQEKKKALEEQKKADEDERLERRRIFMEREAKKRAAAKACSPQSTTHNMLDKVHILQTADDDASTAASTIASTVSDTDNNNRRKKPAWCQSEADREAVEADDEVNLLSFVDGLDFDQYTQDLEIQTLMGQVKDRIKLLEREHKKDETKLQTCLDSESAALRATTLENGSVVDCIPPDIDNDDEHDTQDDTKSIANSVMSQSTNIGSIHSKKSLTALVSKARERIAEMTPIEEDDGKDEAIKPPVLRTVTDDNGARLAEKKSINKLAFTKRNPAL